MVNAVASTFKAGARRMQVAYRDADGYPIGVMADGTIVEPDDAALGETYHAHVVMGYVSNTPPQRDIELATDQADGKNYGDIPMGINSFGTGEITLSQKDEVLFNAVRRARTDTTTSSAMAITAANNTLIDGLSMVVMFTDRVRNEKTGEVEYETTIYHNVTMTVTGEAEAGQTGGTNPANYTMSYSPSPSERLSVTGYLFSSTDLEVLEDTDTHTVIRSKYPLTFSTFLRDGTDTSFTLLYRPQYSDATGAAENIITNNGSLLAVTSVNTTSKLVTLSAAGTSGHVVQVLYQTQFRS